MRKYLFNGAMLAAIVSAWPTFQKTRNGPRDWRLLLMWISWGLAVAIAIGTVAKESQDSTGQRTRRK